ncbi:MAG TPA: dipeptide ABC transporter ATP-binding protein [Ideonella sp.]|nr:dipeptide ABC transporter ATP-binding protein [Ideonella sp.]
MSGAVNGFDSSAALPAAAGPQASQDTPAGPLVLQAHALARHYHVSQGLFQPPATVKALNGVSFSLAAGRTLAVVGESGCGKSTLARALTLIEKPTSGSLQLGGVDIANADAAQTRLMRQQVQMVFQNPYASLNPRKRITQMLAEPLLLNRKLSAAERRVEVASALQQVGLRPEHAERYPHMFSGGQRQRIAIARAMMLQPQLLVADEPTSALDVSIQAQILNLFMDLQQRTGIAYVFISHNLSVVEHIADRVLVMYLGRVVESAPKALLFKRPLHPYTRALLSATPSIDPARRALKIRITGELPSPLAPPPGCSFHKRCPYATERCMVEVPELRVLEGREVACHHAETVG